MKLRQFWVLRGPIIQKIVKAKKCYHTSVIVARALWYRGVLSCWELFLCLLRLIIVSRVSKSACGFIDGLVHDAAERETLTP